MCDLDRAYRKPTKDYVMEFLVKSGRPENQRTPCVVLGVFEGSELAAPTDLADQASDGFIRAILQRDDLEPAAGSTQLLYDIPGVRADRVLLVSLGKKQEFTINTYDRVSTAAARALRQIGATRAITTLGDIPIPGYDEDWRVRLGVVASENAQYVFHRTKTDAPKPLHPLSELTFLFSERGSATWAKAGIEQGVALAAGIRVAKDLSNLPGNICTPTYLAEQAAQIKKGNRRLRLEVLDESRMETLGMGALLSVSRGSEQPAKLIVLHYRGAPRDKAPVVLVGKGITFDSGGISIKPSEAMDEMKFDMCGAASVLGTMAAVAQMTLPINVTGVVASAENMPGSRASRPGDIVTTMSGKTVEILNTDAEGRLVLCDALTYAKRFKPAHVIDIATLTGACIIALGHHPSGLFTANDELANAIISAGEASGDRVWRMPLWDDYQSSLDSNFADMANIGGRPAGSVTAACFLSRFTDAYPWAHLDIAGTAWKSGKEKGATGRPVSLLVHHLMAVARAQTASTET